MMDFEQVDTRRTIFTLLTYSQLDRRLAFVWGASVYKTQFSIIASVTIPAALIWLIILFDLVDSVPKTGFVAGLCSVLFYLLCVLSIFGASSAAPLIKGSKIIWVLLALWNASFVIFRVAMNSG